MQAIEGPKRVDTNWEFECLKAQDPCVTRGTSSTEQACPAVPSSIDLQINSLCRSFTNRDRHGEGRADRAYLMYPHEPAWQACPSPWINLGPNFPSFFPTCASLGQHSHSEELQVMIRAAKAQDFNSSLCRAERHSDRESGSSPTGQYEVTALSMAQSTCV